MKDARIFISYSRRDIDFVKSFDAGLLTAGMAEKDIWIDWKDIPYSTKWWLEVEKGIQQSDVFIFIISPDSAKSEICTKEIRTALNYNKRIIPILHRPVDEYPSTFPGEIREINWIPMSNQSELNENTGELLQAINTDFSWLAEHTRILNKAIEWMGSGKNNSFFLRGDDLTSGEDFISQAASGKEPRPTSLHIDYIQSSRKFESYRKRRNTIIISVVGVVLAIFAVVAIIAGKIAAERAEEARIAEGIAEEKAEEAEISAELAQEKATEASAQSQIALSRQVALNSVSVSDVDLDLKLLLAAQAYKFEETNEAKSSLVYGLLIEPYLVGIRGGYYSYDVGGDEMLEELNRDERFNPSTWEFVDSNIIEGLIPQIMHTPLWGSYAAPSINQNQMAAYSISKQAPGGGAEYSGSYLAVWDTSHVLFEYKEDSICSSDEIFGTQNLSAEQLDLGTFRITDESTGEEIGTFLSNDIRMETQQYQNLQVVGMDVDKTNSTLITAIAYGRHMFYFKIILWDIETEQEIATLLSQLWSGDVYSEMNYSIFSDDDQHVIVCSGEHYTQLDSALINTDPNYWVEKACSIAGRNLTETEWNRFIGAEYEYEITCPQFPAGGYPTRQGQ
jgi:hypothetical protein